jgi:RecA-family ATPase
MADLQAKVFKEPTWIIPNVLPTGNILLAARPKMRKTFLALQLALAVCGGRRFLDWKCNHGDVLFLGLEDNERRLKSRIKLLQTLELNPPDLSGFRYWTGGVDIRPNNGQQFISNPEEAEAFRSAFPKGAAGVDALKRFLDMYPLTRLIVIDTYAHWRDGSNNRDVYQRDVEQMFPLTRLAAEREVCILTIHHEKKGLASQETGDFMEDASGTSGITGTVDGVMSIKGKRGMQEQTEERKLLLSGRDVPNDYEIDMAFDAERGGWQPAARQDVRHSILKLLERHPYMSQSEFGSVLPNVSKSRISQVLTTMKFENLIVQNRLGYSLPRDFKEA